MFQHQTVKFFFLRTGWSQTTIHHAVSLCNNNSSIVQLKQGDYQDFVGIIILLIINSTISFIEENNAGNAAAALMARLAPKAKVLLLL